MTTKDLQELVDSFVESDVKFKETKNNLEKQKELVKQAMEELNEDLISSGDYVCKRSEYEKVDFDEKKLIEVLKSNGVEGVVKKKPYIDFDALENLIYENKLSSDILRKINSTKEVTKIVKLAVTKKKKKEE